MLKHYPDKPWQQDPRYLSEWDGSGRYYCQQKIDGWRVIVMVTPKGLEWISRHNKSLDSEIEPQIKTAAATALAGFPVGSQIDTEWLSRRSCSKSCGLAPKLFLLDLIRYGAEWLLTTPLHQRLLLLHKHCLLTGGIEMPQEAAPGCFEAFYQSQKTIPFSEGVVVKGKESTLVGGRSECAKNPQWMKVKYRA